MPFQGHRFSSLLGKQNMARWAGHSGPHWVHTGPSVPDSAPTGPLGTLMPAVLRHSQTGEQEVKGGEERLPRAGMAQMVPMTCQAAAIISHRGHGAGWDAGARLGRVADE